jgi:hypothetical protein
MLWTTGRSRPTIHRGPGGTVVALLTRRWACGRYGLRCSTQLHKEKEKVRSAAVMNGDSLGCSLRFGGSSGLGGFL